MDNTPPALNLKCIIFTGLLASGYWYLPARNKYVLVALLYFPYLAMAWYDWIYACKHNFGPTYLAHFYSWAKPQNSKQIEIYKKWAPSIKKTVQNVDIAVVVCLLILLPFFLTWKPRLMTEREKQSAENRVIFIFLIIIGLFAYLRLNY